ncbi:RloB family protein [Nocardiopsis flavescens]|uniref:RloB family protein n=1 Tax=Nocardiopsis flavescens TaxID=758803 RepID=UPI0015BA083C|nr:RloB family protein [Nocardiopsis flavescens]
MASKSKEKRGKPLNPHKIGTREPKRRFLIFCEDTYGGTTYFRKLKQEERLANVSIDIGPDHGEPYQLVKAAEKRRDSPHPRRREQGGGYDEVWCVIDVEAPESHTSLDRALRSARVGGIEIAYANPCFELWLLLHQRDVFGHLTTGEAVNLMRGLKCCYNNSKDFNPDHFMGEHQRNAITRAERLAKQHEGTHHIRQRNPGTDIHVLVRRILGRQ